MNTRPRSIFVCAFARRCRSLFGSQYVAQASISLRRLSSASLRRYACSALSAERARGNSRPHRENPLFIALHESGHGTSRQLAQCSDMSGVEGRPEMTDDVQNGAFDATVWSGRAEQEVSSTWLMRSCI